MKKETLEKANRLTEKIRELKKLQKAGFEISISMFANHTMSIGDTDNEGYFKIEAKRVKLEMQIGLQIEKEIEEAINEFENL